MITECNRLLLLLISGCWIIQEGSPAGYLLQETLDEVLVRAICSLRCLDELCETDCIQRPGRIEELDEEAGADARLICRGQSYIVLAHNRGNFIIVSYTNRGERPQRDVILSAGPKVTISLLDPDTWYAFDFHRITTEGFSKPETIRIQTMPDAHYTPADVTNVTAKIFPSTKVHITWNAEISFQPSADCPCIYQVTCRPDNGNYTETTKLNEAEEFRVTFKDMPPGANFTVRVSALTETQKWGNFPNLRGTVMTFTTPRCQETLWPYRLRCVPSAVGGLNATTIHKMGNIFDVHLTWDEPEEHPDEYIVSILPIGLRTTDRFSKTVCNKDELKTVFLNVTIFDEFDVYVQGVNRWGDGPEISKRFTTRPKEIGRLEGLNVTTTHKVGNTFDIHVTWERPELFPDFYIVNVTSNSPEANDPVFQNISGSANETVFSDVQLSKEFNLYVTAWSSAIRSAVTSRFLVKTETPIRQIGTFKPIYLAGPILVVLGFAIGTAVYRYYKLRRRRLRQSSNTDEFEMTAKNLTITRVLGNGAFGIVKLGSMRDDDGNVTLVAVKMLRDDSNENDRRHFLHEMKIMKSLDKHPNIVSLLGCCTIGPYPFLVVEYCSRGDLHSFLRKSLEKMTMSVRGEILQEDTEGSSTSQSSDNYVQVGNFSGDQDTNCGSEVVTVLDMLNFGRQIATGMEFLSSSRVVHRDLATRNVLVCDHRTVKISDFGLSRDICQENRYKKTGNGRMPLKWMAIEALTHQIYTTYSDVWSFGVLLWEIVTLGGEPYPGIPTLEILIRLQSGYRMERPTNCSIPLYNVMRSCWQARPKDRPTFSTLRQELDKLICMATKNEYVDLNDVTEQMLPENDHSKISSFRPTSCPP